MTNKNNMNQTHKAALKRSIKLGEKYIDHLIAAGRVDKTSLKYHELVLKFFGCGNWKYGPGTFTSFITCCLWLATNYIFFLNETPLWAGTIIWTSLSIIIFFYGVFIVPIYSKVVGVEDHPSIVLDEVLGQLVSLLMTYPLIHEYYFAIENTKINSLVILCHIGFCFLSFRFLDIAKPSIIGRIDREVKGGVGVMLDDLISGIISGILGILMFKTLVYYLNAHS
jgi:phosphatidylglycerophosphatase A